MSAILKALRRVEDEKRAQIETGLREAVATPRAGNRRHRRSAAKERRSWLLGALSGAAVLAISWAIWSIAPWDSEQAETIDVAAASSATPRAVGGSTASPPRALVRPPSAPLPTTVASPPPPEVAAPARPTEPAPPPTRAAPIPEVKTANAAPPPPSPRKTVSAAPPAPSPPTTVSAAPPAPSAPKAARAAPRPKPATRKAAVAASPPPGELVHRSGVPDIKVVKTVWHPIADRRTATIETSGSEGRIQIQEGDSLGPLTVSEIKPVGVIFDHDGVRFTRAIGAK